MTIASEEIDLVSSHFEVLYEASVACACGAVKGHQTSELGDEAFGEGKRLVHTLNNLPSFSVVSFSPERTEDFDVRVLAVSAEWDIDGSASDLPSWRWLQVDEESKFAKAHAL